MAPPNLVPVELTLRAATNQEYAALTQFNNRMRVESLPDDPPVSLQETIARLRNIPPFVDVSVWAIWTPDHTAILAVGDVAISRLDQNQHVAQFDLEVLPEYRRQGLARRLLPFILDVVEREERRLMVTTTKGWAAPGDEFMLRLGALKGLASTVHQLKLVELDRDLIERWQAQGRERAAGFELGLWEGPYPEDEIEAIAELYEVMNSAPRGALDTEDYHFSTETLRQMEQSVFASGSQRWTIYARERATERLAGYTELIWNPSRPTVLHQGATGVFPQYRNHGLGRWLKAAMLDKVLNERPEAQFIRTTNADSNAAMLKINTELGFEPYMSEVVWQIETQKVRQYLYNHSK